MNLNLPTEPARWNPSVGPTQNNFGSSSYPPKPKITVRKHPWYTIEFLQINTQPAMKRLLHA